METWSLDVISYLSFFDKCSQVPGSGAVTYLEWTCLSFGRQYYICFANESLLNHDSGLPLADANQGQLCDFKRELR